MVIQTFLPVTSSGVSFFFSFDLMIKGNDLELEEARKLAFASLRIKKYVETRLTVYLNTLDY